MLKKKLISLVLALAVAAPCCAPPVCADTGQNDNVLYFNDGTKTDSVYGGGVRSLFTMNDGSGEHKDYLKYGKTSSTAQIIIDIPKTADGSTLKLGKARVSFDVCAQQTDHFFIMMIGDENGASQETFLMNGMGKMAYQMDGAWPTATYSPSCRRNYDKNRWYNVQIDIDLNERLLVYSIDGEYWGETSVTRANAFVNSQPDKIYFNIMTDYTIKAGAVTKSDGSEEFWLDNISYSFADSTEPGISVSTGADGNIFFSKKDINTDFVITNPTDTECDYTLNVTADTADNHRAFETSRGVKIGANQSETVKVTFDVPRYGFYTLSANITDGDGNIKAECDTRFSALNGRSDGVRNEKIGISNHFGHQYGSPDVILPLDVKMGFGTARDDVAWPHIVSNSGEQLYDNVFYRNFLNWSQKTADSGMDILAIVGGAGHPGLLGYSWPASEDKLDRRSMNEWAKHIESLVSSKPDIESWEIYNEWNINSNAANGGTPEAYALVLKTASEAVRKANPNAKIVAFCTALVDTEWIERVLNALGDNPGRCFDAISVHPYITSGEMPEKGGLENSIASLHELMNKYGLGDKEVWSTEFGYSTGAVVHPVTEKTQAEYTVRGNLILDPYVDKNIMYTVVQKQNMSNAETGFGMLRTYSGRKINYEARPLGAAITNYNNLMAGASYIGKNVTPDGTYTYFYRTSSGKRMTVIWNTEGTLNVSARLGTDRVKQYDIFGNETDLYASGGVHTFCVSGSPLYIISDTENFDICDAPLVSTSAFGVTVAVNDNFRINLTNNIPDTEITADTSNNITQQSTDANGGSLTLSFATGANHTETDEYRFDGISTADSVQLTAKDKFGRVYYTAPITVDYKSAAKAQLDILPYKNGRWQAVVDITNSKDTLAVSGSVKCTKPAQMAQVYKERRFENLASGQSDKIVFNIPEFVGKDETDFEFEIMLDDGQVQTLSDASSFVAVEKQRTAPTIDGVISDGEWNTKSAVKLDNLSQVKQISNWGGTADLSGSLYMGYDEKYFYLAAKVTDDIHFDHDDQNRLYTVDSLQFAFAPEKDKNSKRTEIGLALMDGKPTIVRYSYAGGVSLLGIPDSALEYDLNKFVDTDYAVTNNGSETVYELKIPWGELFGPSFTVGSVGSVYFSALINDNDGNGRRGWIELCGGIGTVKDASEFTKIPLVK